MTLPNFIVVGAQRSGSTWLHDVLDRHPRIYVPTRRKEVHFFNKFYERGTSWYEGFFPDASEVEAYDAIGEVTPTYMYKGSFPERLRATLPEVRLMMILRNPVDRAYSHYQMWQQNNAYRGSFEDMLAENQGAFDYGLYGLYLSRILEHVERERVCVLIYEEAVANVADTKRTVADFLGTSADLFPPEAGQARVGGSSLPRARSAYALGKNLARFLQRHDLDWIVNLSRRTGVKRWLGRQGKAPPMASGTRRELLARYQEDVARLEELLGRELAHWKQ